MSRRSKSEHNRWVDDVLVASQRGHSAADVVRAVQQLRAAGLEVGLHLMIGLPGDR